MFPHTKPPVGTQINPLHPLSRGLVGGWLFNEGAGSLANDISGNKNHGRLKNMAPNVQGSGWGSSKFGGVLGFDGIDDWVALGTPPLFDFKTIDFTMCFKVELNSIANDMALFSSWNTGTEQYLLKFESTNPHFKFAMRNTVGAYYIADMPNNTAIQDAEYYICVTRKNNKISIYQDSIVSPDVVTLVGTIQNMTEVFIGKFSDTEHLNGEIISAMVYNRALSAEEISWLYREPYIMFEPAFNPALLYSAPPPVGAIWYYNMLRRRNR